MRGLFSEDSIILNISPPLAASTCTTATTTGVSVLDMQALGFNSVCFFASQWATTGTGYTLTAAIGSTSADSAAYGVASPGTTKVAVTIASTKNSEFTYLDMKNLLHRYVTCSKQCSTGGDWSGVWAVLYNAATKAVTASTDVTAANTFNCIQPTTTSA